MNLRIRLPSDLIGLLMGRHFRSCQGFMRRLKGEETIASIQVFVDESGVDRQGPVLAFCAVIAAAENWRALSDEWKAILDAAPRLKKFSMREARGQLRTAKLKALIPVMKAHPFLVLERVWDLSAFDEVFKPVVHPPLDQPYFWMYSDIMMRAAYQVLALGQTTEPFEIIFDENKHFGAKARAWYPLFRELTRARDPRIYPILPVDPMFKTDEKFMPLQAADIFAWLCRRNVSGEQNPFSWVQEWIKPEIRFSSFSGVMTREQLELRVAAIMKPKVRAQTEAFLRRGLV